MRARFFGDRGKGVGGVKKVPSSRSRLISALAAAAATLIVTSAHAASIEEPWKRGASWTTFRAGYVKSLEGGAPNAWGGYGFGFSHMLSERVSLGLFIHHELLGKFGGAAQIEIPVTAEYAYALKWNTALKPYVGVGLGAFYHKIYRSGADRTELLPATLFKFGADTALDEHNVLGMDSRIAWVANDDETVDPVFGKSKPTSIRWSIKLQFSRVF
jgi:hypothetical protein